MSGLSDLATATLGAGGVTGLIAIIAKRLPPSRGDIQTRADRLVADTLERYQEDNKGLAEEVRQSRVEMAEFRDWATARMGQLDAQHTTDITQRDRDRARIYELEQQVRTLQAELDAQKVRTVHAEQIAADMSRDRNARTRDTDT